MHGGASIYFLLSFSTISYGSLWDATHWLVTPISHFPACLLWFWENGGRVRGFNGCTRCYKTTAAANPASLFWPSGNLRSAHTAQQRSATGIQVVSLLMVNIIQISGFLLTIVVSTKSDWLFSQTKRSDSLKCGLISTLASNSLPGWLERPPSFWGPQNTPRRESVWQMCPTL